MAQGRRADSALLTRLGTLRNDMAVLEADLRRYGDRELAEALQRARREFDTGAVRGILNTVGIDARAVR